MMRTDEKLAQGEDACDELRHPGTLPAKRPLLLLCAAICASLPRFHNPADFKHRYSADHSTRPVQGHKSCGTQPVLNLMVGAYAEGGCTMSH